MQLAAIALSILMITQPPPTPQPITGTLPLSNTIGPWMTPITYTESYSMDLHILDKFKQMVPLAITIMGKPLSTNAIGTLLKWRVGVLALVFVIDFVLGKLGRPLLALIPESLRNSRVVRGTRLARETAARGRKLRGGRA